MGVEKCRDVITVEAIVCRFIAMDFIFPAEVGFSDGFAIGVVVAEQAGVAGEPGLRRRTEGMLIFDMVRLDDCKRVWTTSNGQVSD